MLRLRFTSGIILGLVLGVAAGVVIGLLILPPRPGDQNATSLQVQELTRKLEASREDKQRVDRQLEQFQKLAEQMTASFNTLELRFKALEHEQQLREAPGQPPPAPEVRAPPPAAVPAPAGGPDSPPAEAPDTPQ